MVSLEFCDKHNMVAYLEKSEGSEGFHQIIDFQIASHINNALTECPNLYASPIEQFWQTAALSTTEDGVRGITATIDRKVKVFVSETSIRRHLNPEDSKDLKTLPTSEIFQQLALMRFIQIFLNKRKRMLFPHKRTFPTPTLTKKLFSNMKRVSKGYSGVDIPLFPTMLTTPESSPSRITSSPSLSPQTHSSTSQPPSNQTTPITEEASPMPHESPLKSVHSLGRNKGSLSLNELTDLCTSLSKKVESLESELKQTKQTYYTTLCFQVIDDIDKSTITVGVKAKDKGKAIMHKSEIPKKFKTRVQVQISVDEELAKKVFEEEQARFNAEQEARFKAEQEQERIDFETALELQKQLDERKEVAAKVDQAHDTDWSDPAVLRYHAADQGRIDDTQISDQPEEQLGVFSAATALADAARRRQSVENVQTYTRRRREVSTGSGRVSTASRLEARFKTEQEQERIDFETTLELQKQLDEREEVAAKVDQAQDTDWSDPAVLRYHTLQNRPFSMAKVRKNMCLHLKNQGGCKMSHFKGMSYERQ
ncbi:hypothetical protein Tco_0551460 [Tanacetum coccineum]